MDVLTSWLTKEYDEYLCSPNQKLIFSAFQNCPEHKVKIAILGQDPYPAQGVADGMAFSTQKSAFIPASLKNILIESGNTQAKNGHLNFWASQGVLLLNTVLTTRVHEAYSHRDKGWEAFTEATIRYLAEKERPIVFMLWGNQAKKQAKLLRDLSHVLVLESGHPSPLSANRGHWFGNNHFQLANDFLLKIGLEPVDWNLSSDPLNRESTLF
jgi:uracil-DNA glycosylase